MTIDVFPQPRRGRCVMTIDAFPQPRRGRKPTGKALSAAERKRAQRLRDKEAASYAEYAEMSTTGLLEALAAAVRDKSPRDAEALSAELVKRATG